MIMANSLDFQKIHTRYEEEGVPHGVSIVDFCQRNGISYKQYERWFKNRKNVKIYPVELTFDSSEEVSATFADTSDQEGPNDINQGSSVMFNVKIVTNTGMLLHQRNLDYSHLLSLIQKLEVLC